MKLSLTNQSKLPRQLYRYNDESLEFQTVDNHFGVFQLSLIISCILGFILLTGVTHEPVKEQPNVEYEQTMNLVTTIELNHENLKAEIAKYNFKYPQIIYAQAILESNNFKSNICLENNNLFGMREAKQRTTTATGTENNHASYKNWQDSVIDRALFETSFLRTIQTQEQYFAYIGRNYAEAGNYVEQLKKIINQMK